ncbi:hypothetical protein [Pseudomonas sp. CGJS7]|uniref:hypothetical protein n=1 Tax=Pseudomonas sp. CGJS7 TaxID=3109348 RepID=UPI003008C33F
MTWFADEILIPATAQAVQRIVADPLLAPFAYWVRDLDDHPWHAEEHRHGLPEGGLIAIRPVRDTRGDEGDDSWYGTPSLEWSSLRPKHEQGPEPDRIGRRLAMYLLECTSGETPAADTVPEDVDSLPPPSLRRYLSELAAELSLPVLYHSACFWGGAVEYEYSLCYRQHEALFLTKPPEPGDEAVRHALHDGLAGVGVNLPSAYFALHAREFPWEQHRLKPGG